VGQVGSQCELEVVWSQWQGDQDSQEMDQPRS
jgi:hypothetical protein